MTRRASARQVCPACGAHGRVTLLVQALRPIPPTSARALAQHLGRCQQVDGTREERTTGYRGGRSSQQHARDESLAPKGCVLAIGQFLADCANVALPRWALVTARTGGGNAKGLNRRRDGMGHVPCPMTQHARRGPKGTRQLPSVADASRCVPGIAAARVVTRAATGGSVKEEQVVGQTGRTSGGHSPSRLSMATRRCDHGKTGTGRVIQGESAAREWS